VADEVGVGEPEKQKARSQGWTGPFAKSVTAWGRSNVIY
jgi:hypothetical protein